MDISLQGYNHKTTTFLSGTSDLAIGEPVSMSGNFEVSRATSGDEIIGICANVFGDYASVITQGVVEVAYSGTAPSVGVTGLLSSGSGALKVDLDSMTLYHIISVDTTNKILTIIL